MAFGLPAYADPPNKDIQGVIRQQLDAFLADDAATAFSFAAPSIRSMFGTPDNFMAMVRQGYPPVYRSQSADFGPLETTDGELIQEVNLIGPDGRTWLALYTMEKQPDGTWRIAACRLLEGPQTTA